MELADRFDLPVVSLVDTAGAWPGVDAEERGQAEAIARATDASLSLGDAQRRRGRRRRRLGRRAGDRRLQQGADARALDLHRRLARGRRLDPLARLLARPGRGDQHEDHRPGPAEVRHHRRDRAGAGRRRPSRSRRRRSRRPGAPSPPRWTSSATCRAKRCATRGRRSSSPSGRKL